MRRSRKPLSVCADPGFESLSLRHFTLQLLGQHNLSETLKVEDLCLGQLAGTVEACGTGGPPRLVKRGGIDYFRMALPEDRAAALGRGEVLSTSRTTYRAEAISSSVQRRFARRATPLAMRHAITIASTPHRSGHT